MDKYQHVQRELKQHGIRVKDELYITDELRIKEYDELVLQGKELPNGVKKELRIETILDDYIEDDSLPNNIKKRHKVLHDVAEVKEVEKYYKKNHQTPKGIIRELRGDHPYNGYVFSYEDEYEYFKQEYNYYEEQHLTSDQIKAQLELKNTRQLQSISNSLRFFVVLVIVILLYIILSSMYG